MKKLLLPLLILFAFSANAQISKKQMFYHLASQSGGASTAIPNVDFTFKHIQRTNADISLSASITGAPTVTSIVWQVRNKSGVLVGMATGGLSATIPAITTRGFYDLYCWVKTATDQYPIEWEDAFYDDLYYKDFQDYITANGFTGNYYQRINTDAGEAVHGYQPSEITYIISNI